MLFSGRNANSIKLSKPPNKHYLIQEGNILKINVNTVLFGDIGLKTNTTHKGKHKLDISFQNGLLGGLSGLCAGKGIRTCLPRTPGTITFVAAPLITALATRAISSPTNHHLKLQYFSKS